MNAGAVAVDALATESCAVASATGPRRARLPWVDVARGIGIILVVYGHALRGLYWPPESMPPWAQTQDNWIYAFHMPLFFIIAGMFAWPSLRRSRAAFARSKLVGVFYPYLLWSLIAGGIELLFSPVVNSPLRAADLLAVPVRPIEQFWFLYSLFLIQIFVMLLYPRKAAVYLAALVSPLLFYGVGGGGLAVQTLLWVPYFVCGIAAAAALGRLSGAMPKSALAAALVSAATFVGLMMVARPQGIAGVVPGLATGAAGSLAVLSVSMLLREGAAMRFLAALGEASLAIYVMHTIASAGVRIGLRAIAAPIHPLALLAVMTVAGLAFPYAAYLFARKRGLAPWLGLGAVRQPEPQAAQ